MSTAAPTAAVSARLTPEAVERIEAEALRREWSRSQTIARAIEIGLNHLESQVALPFGGAA